MGLAEFDDSHSRGLQDLRSAGLGCSLSPCPVIVSESGHLAASAGETRDPEEQQESAGSRRCCNFRGFTGGTGGPAVAVE